MKPIDTTVPAETRTCLQYWPVTSSISLDIGIQTPYEGFIASELALGDDFERLRLSDSGSPQVGIYSLIHEAFLSEELQSVQLRKHAEVSSLDTRTTSLCHESRITELALQHPTIQRQSSDNNSAETVTPKLSTEGCYARLLSYIRQSTQDDGHVLTPSDKVGMPVITRTRKSLLSDNNMDSKESKDIPSKRLYVYDDTDPKHTSKRVCTTARIPPIGFSHTDDGNISNNILSANLDDEAKNDNANSVNNLRSIEMLDAILAEIFEEEDELATNENAKAQLFQRIAASSENSLILEKHTVRRLHTLLNICDPTSIQKHISGERLGRLFDLLISTIDAAKNIDLATILRDGMLVERSAGFTDEYCRKLGMAILISCIGLDTAVLAFSMGALGKALHISSAAEMIHGAGSFLKGCLLDCVVPLLDVEAECELTDALLNKEGILSDRIQLFLEGILAANNSVAELVAQRTLCDEDVVPLVYASISAMFCSGEILSCGIGANLFESIRRSSRSFLRIVFEAHVNQRLWILEEILASLVRLQAQKRVPSMHHIAGGKSVQFTTVLLLQLLQTTAKSPEDLSAGFQGSDFSAKECRMLLQRHKKAVSTAASSTDFVIRYLIGRCTRRDGRATAIETGYRAMLETFINDCIVLLGHPQWPAAELVVRIYSYHILEILDEDKSDIAIKNMALEGAAHIASHIAQWSLTSDEVTETNSNGKGLELVSSSSSLEAISRFRNVTTTLLGYLQSKTASGESTGAIPLYVSGWASLIVAVLLKGSRQRAGNATGAGNDNCAESDVDGGEDGFDLDENGGSDEEECSEDSDQGEQGTRDKAPYEAFNTEKRKAIEGCLRGYADIICQSTKTMPTHCSYIGAAEAARAALTLQPLFRSFEMLLARVILALGAGQVTLRSKALRALNQIAVHRPSVLYQSNVKYAINHRLQDSSPQVREVAIDLIGKHIAQNPELTDQYYEFISVRILDKGPSVRRRVMRILASIYVLSKDTVQLVDIGARLLQRTNDEERSIRELALKTLHELWFSLGEYANVDNSSPEAESTSNVFNMLSPETQRKISLRVRVMTGVLDATCSREVADLMADLFDHVTVALSRPEAEEAMFVIRCVIDALFEQLLRAEESPMVCDTANGADAAAAGFSVTSCLRFIATLSSIAPDTVGRHVETLGTYLRMSNTADEDMVLNTLIIFSNTILRMPHPSTTFLVSLEQNLISLLSSSPQSVLSVAVPCLCLLIDKLTWNHAKLIRLFRSCVLQLYKEQRTINSGAMSTASPKNLMRFIVLGGLLSRHFDFENHRERLKEHFKELELLAEGGAIGIMNDLLLFYATAQQPAPVQLAAIQMLGQLYIKRPGLALEARARGMMDRIFASGSVQHKLQVLRNFLEFLRADAKQLATREHEDRYKEREVDAKALVGDTGGMSEAGVGASLMQTYLDRIIDATFVANAVSLRTAGFEVISHVLEQGLAHPLKCMPALIALCTSSDSYTRAKSLKLHQELNFKYASFIHSRDLEGVRQMYEYQLLVCGSPEDVEGYDSRVDLQEQSERPSAYLQFLYTLSRNKRTRRNELLGLLVKTCDPDSSLTTRKVACKTDIPFVRFVSENISALEFKYLDEVLHVIYQISAAIASSGLSLYHQFEAEASTEIGTAEHTSCKEQQWQQTTEESVCISILFVLREFLKAHYGISEARCALYDPSNSAGVRDKAVTWHALSDRGRLDWSAFPSAMRCMESMADYSAQRTRFRHMMAESLAKSQESPMLADSDAHLSPDARSDVPGEMLAGGMALDAEEMEMLSLDGLDNIA
ncbi:ARM repeat-containing protein [Coemansia reversa NRRL 1564]|uniref:Sister chromatid cohesion protein n=1 Tax=Coemansia reversa (strain ATCC 12441 / NRRL 1564) TaxID=763665 RepID=A0A2G5BF39_COERN|nr:ARM repeat-containing protein [Coemansia reversa NRRL 1564]|eukprot:PIA17602.1 ARM repeat-containing protein [Coemansia reversa NRRL 1564]